MKIALIGDVHANLPALEAVLAHARAMGATEIWNSGDTLGYGPYPTESAALLARISAISVIGNVDRKILKWSEAVPRPALGPVQCAKRASFAWTARQLSARIRDQLQALPVQRRLRRAGLRLLLVHSSPKFESEYVSAGTPKRRLRELARSIEADVVICGHAHQPFAVLLGGVLFINTGSVGRPDDGDPRACYALMDLRAGRPPSVVHYRVLYDLDRSLAALRRARLPAPLRAMLQSGVSLEAVLGVAKTPAPAPASATSPPARRAAAALAASAAEPHAIAQARAIKERYQPADAHPDQVTRLALRIFDGLRSLHRLGSEERLWLECAGLMHDIGWAMGRKGHHKASLAMIMAAPELAFNPRLRLACALIARYHRRALPSKRHRRFSGLDPAMRRTIEILGAILRAADALDASHSFAVKDISCSITSRTITLLCSAINDAAEERDAVTAKAGWLGQVFNRVLRVTFRSAPRGAQPRSGGR